MIKLPYHIKSIIIGLLLLHGYIVFTLKSKNEQFLTLCLNHSDYLDYVFKYLSYYCPLYPLFRKRSRDGPLTYSL